MSDLFIDLTTPNGVKYRQPVGLFINGKFVASSSGKKFPVENPVTEDHVVDVYEAEEQDVDAAVDAAEEAFEKWSTMPSSDRSRILYKYADIIESHSETVIAIECMDTGKTLAQATGDLQLSIDTIRNFAGYADKLFGDVIDTDVDHLTYTRREPIGVCGQIIPWNFPIMLWSWKIAPALAAGNTVVLKTAESTPLSALYVANLAGEAGLPAGVMNIVSGYGKTGQFISAHPRIKKIAFTGSTATGRHVMKAAAMSNLKKVTLELGGKSPQIVFNCADLEVAVQCVWAGLFSNSGQVCCAGSRVYCQSGIYDKFVAKFKAMTESKPPGDPYHPSSAYGPQANRNQLDRVMAYIEHGKKSGARLVTGGNRMGEKGYFIEPTVFADVDEDMKIVKEEIFGPVITVHKFETIDEVIKKANDTHYGLAAGIFTSNLSVAHHVASKIKAGTVWINTYNDFHHQVPFGGFGQSGFGRELGVEALDSYLQTKAVRIGNIITTLPK